MSGRGFLKSIGIVGGTLLVPNVPGFIYDKVHGHVSKPTNLGLLIDEDTTKRLFEEHIMPGIIKEVEASSVLWDRFNNTS